MPSNLSSNRTMYARPKQNFDLQKARVVQVEDVKGKSKVNPLKRSNYHMLKNSPQKDSVSPKKEMFRSLYGHSFGPDQQKSSEKGSLLSTLGMNNWRGKHKSLNRK